MIKQKLAKQKFIFPSHSIIYSPYGEPKSIIYSRGFTIVELLVVIVVIGILAAITVVSYTGISNRAAISSLQSDLVNAATILKLDQVTNSAFPATLALANSGKGITQSQSLDTIIYVPDNMSSPNNFCLQYRKGANTYAIDNSSAPTKGVCLTNLITNGDFSLDSNSDGLADGWSHSGSSGNYITNKIEYFMSSITGFSGALLSPDIGLSRDKHYIAFDAVSIAAVAYLAEYFISGSDWNQSPVYNGHVSGMVIPHQTSTYPYYLLAFYPTAVGVYSAVSNVVFINLTRTFGAGNEPTRLQMDTIMNSYPNKWINIVAKANL